MERLIFSKEFKDYKVVINMPKPNFTDTSAPNTYIWGFPYTNTNEIFMNQWCDDVLNETEGYFFAIRVTNDAIEIANDFLAGYRVYYCDVDSTITISDDWSVIVEALKEHEQLQVNKEQFLYWKKHRYTLNEQSLISDLYKFSPASRIRVDGTGMHVETYFRQARRNSNYKLFLEEGYKCIKEQLLKIKYKENRQILLFYSGGADSTLLLLMCKELDIPVKCIVIEYLPEWSINQRDKQKAIDNLNALNVAYDLVEVNLIQAFEKYGEAAAEDMLFNRHLAVHFYETYDVVATKYGKNVIILNGQSADSILSFGPSEYTLGNMAKRAIIAFMNTPLANIVNCLLLVLNRRYEVPATKKDSYRAMLDDTNYKFLIDKKCECVSIIDNEIKIAEARGIQEYESMRIYLKMISFLQGSDNQIVIKAANKSGISGVVMPYTSPKFVYLVMTYKNNLLEIVNPKYFVRDLLRKKYTYKPKSINEACSLEKDFDMDKLEKDIMNLYDKKIRQLIGDRG